MRLIDADELLFNLGKDQAYLEDERLTNRSLGIGDAIIELLSAPTVDAVEVVRCKDCVFGRTGEGVGVGKWNIDCLNPNISKYRLPTDYCSYGERKEE